RTPRQWLSIWCCDIPCRRVGAALLERFRTLISGEGAKISNFSVCVAIKHDNAFLRSRDAMEKARTVWRSHMCFIVSHQFTFFGDILFSIQTIVSTLLYPQAIAS